jgi:hypothetical protein
MVADLSLDKQMLQMFLKKVLKAKQKRALVDQLRDSYRTSIRVEMASKIPPYVANKKDPPGEKNYLSFFSEILYDTPSREKTCA